MDAAAPALVNVRLSEGAHLVTAREDGIDVRVSLDGAEVRLPVDGIAKAKLVITEDLLGESEGRQQR